VNLGYRDSGMAGTPDNQRPDAFTNAEDDAVAGTLVELIREERPQILITFDANGGYGHPDHIKVHRAAHLAFERADDASWYPDGGAPWQPSRLFHVAFVREQFTAMWDDLKRRGIPVDTGMGSVSDDEVTQLGVPRADVTTLVDIRSTLSRKLDAFRCYATQTPADFFFLQVSPELLGEEAFVLAASTGGPIPRHGLFEGLSGGE
jgi:N-acetyl-1-D-myo-inositol-2-amino-2-deoxy-alpha-D-glucopyranoside deacetylase